MTPEEINILTDKRTRLNMIWAGPSLIKAELDKPGLTGASTYLDAPTCVKLYLKAPTVTLTYNGLYKCHPLVGGRK